MSDNELLNCYYGIQERIKDIDHRIERDERPDPGKDREVFYNQTYGIGGEVYGLMQKEKVLLEEMKKRHIEP
jgi:hypothetical protein